MAEYTEVCRQHDRMCSCFENCSDCPFHKKVVQCIKKIGGARYIAGNAEEAEKLIMAWAAEHPEPEFPTWTEYFRMTGVFPSWSGHEILDKTHIPADLAQKLGIEPKT